MLDGRVLEASQVEYNPFGKPPLQREVSSLKSSIQWRTNPPLPIPGRTPEADLRTTHSEVYDHIVHFKFPGPGQRNTPVADLRTTQAPGRATCPA